MIYLELFYTFFKIGLFTFGGGYAMIPMINDEVLGKGWATLQTVVDFIAVSESTPGPFAVNVATFIGNSVGGLGGAVCATLGVVLPSFIVILIIAKFFTHFKDNKIVSGAIYGLRAGVVGLILNAGVSILLLAILPGYELGTRISANVISLFDYKAIAIFITMFILSKLMKKPQPILIIVISIILGLVMYGIF